uniref:Uncharacterized protein n=1 Tax=Zea mays TaxID=4577 RepID=A0A804NE18_MAIZE
MRGRWTFTRGHDGRSDRGGAPVGVRGLDERGGGGGVRARHGRPRHDVVLHHAVVAVEFRRRRRPAPRRQDVQPRRRDVRLHRGQTAKKKKQRVLITRQFLVSFIVCAASAHVRTYVQYLENAGLQDVGATRRELRHHRRRPDVHHGPGGVQHGGRAGAGVDVAEDGVGVGCGDRGAREDVRVDGDFGAGGRWVAEQNGRAARALHLQALPHPQPSAPQAHDDLASHLVAGQGVGQALAASIVDGGTRATTT